MSNTHPHRLHRFVTAAFLVTGILVTVMSTKNLLQAKLQPVGLTRIEVESGEELTQVNGHFAADILNDDDTGPIVVGMLLVLAGFSFHALYVVRHREPVHVTVKRERTARRRAVRRKR